MCHIYNPDVCFLFTNSWDIVHTYKVQFSNDTLVWKPCMNGTEEAVSEHPSSDLPSTLCIRFTF